MKRPVWYVAHPVGGDVVGNLSRVRDWLRFLLDEYPDTAFTIPWLAYVEVLDESLDAHRIRGIRDDLAMLERCDGLVLVGGRISPGMELELTHATEHGLQVIDLLYLGKEAP